MKVDHEEVIPAILRLKQEQLALSLEKRRVAKELKNAERRRARLRRKARQLTDTDLASVIAMRTQVRELAVTPQAKSKACPVGPQSTDKKKADTAKAPDTK